jgi:hypothetical protein
LPVASRRLAEIAEIRSVEVMTAETILQEVRLWPQSEQLNLAILIIQQAQTPLPTDEEKSAAFRQVRGKFKGLLGAEEFREEKRMELEIEERRYAERFGRHASKANDLRIENDN